MQTIGLSGEDRRPIPAGAATSSSIDRDARHDARLIERLCERGDSDALNDLLERFGPLVSYRLKSRFGLQPADVDSVLHESLYEVWKNRTSFDRQKGLFAWFVGIARNCARRSLQRRKDRAISVDDLRSVPDQDYELPSEAHETAGPAAAVGHPITAGLSDEEREILLYRYSTNGSWQDLADHTGVRAGTLRTRYSRCLERIRSAFGWNDRTGDDQPTAARGQSVRPHVLVTEDCSTTRRHLDCMLQTSGADVTLATNGREAIEAVQTHANIDLILMDMMMPEVDGVEAIRVIRRMGYTGRIVVLADTCSARIFDQCIAAGCEYMTKPVHPDRLERLLRA